MNGAENIKLENPEYLSYDETKMLLELRKNPDIVRQVFEQNPEFIKTLEQEVGGYLAKTGNETAKQGLYSIYTQIVGFLPGYKILTQSQLVDAYKDEFFDKTWQRVVHSKEGQEKHFKEFEHEVKKGDTFYSIIKNGLKELLTDMTTQEADDLISDVLRNFVKYFYNNGSKDLRVGDKINIQLDKKDGVIKILRENKPIYIYDWEKGKPRKQKMPEINNDLSRGQQYESMNNFESVRTLVDKYFDKYNFEYLQKEDIMALITFESFGQMDDVKNGSIGLMQITSVPIRDIAKHYNLFDPKIMQNLFGQRTRDALTNTKSASKRYDILRKFNANTKYRLNPDFNVQLGMAYLKRVEKTMSDISSNVINLAIRRQDYFKEIVGYYLGNKNIPFDGDKFDKLMQRFKTDKDLQKKYMIFRQYNGDSNVYATPNHQGITHRNYFGMTILYLSQLGK